MNNDKKKKIILISSISVAIILVGVLLLLFGNEKVQYNVLFNSNGGTSVEAITVDENGYIKKPTDPTKENYMFAGWYYNGELYDFSKPVTGDITLEARWVELVDVSGIELDQTKLTLGVGKKAKLIVTIKPENARDKSVIWSSSNTDVVSVDKDGNVTAIKAGTATITVTTKDGKYKAEAEVTVSADVVNVKSVSLDKTSLDLKVNETGTLKATVKPSDATNKGVTWSSSNSNVASVDNNGKVTAKAAGTATITVTTKDGNYKATCKVTVTSIKVTGVALNKTSLELNVGSGETLTATVKPSDATNKGVTWSSSDSDVVSVDNNGKVTAKKAGTATITVTTKDGNYKAECTVTVTNVNVTGVSLNKTSMSLYIDEEDTLTAIVEPSNATNKDVTWSSSDSSVASVDENGKVTAKKAGTATITVTTADGSKTATCTVIVSERPANYVVKFTPYRQEGTGAVLQYTIAVTKNGEAFTNYSKIIYDGKPTGTYLAADRYNENIVEATIILSDDNRVTARVEY